METWPHISASSRGLLHLAQSQGSDFTRRMHYLEALSPDSEGGNWANSRDSESTVLGAIYRGINAPSSKEGQAWVAQTLHLVTNNCPGQYLANTSSHYAQNRNCAFLIPQLPHL